jgi:hypothetical protein
MRTPSMVWFARYMRAAGLIIAGMIIGAAMFMAAYQHNFDLLFRENQQLRTENEEIRKTLEPYIKDKNRTAIVRQIKINIFTPASSDSLDEITTTELRRKLQSDLEVIRGRSFDSAADSLLVARRIIHRKVYTLVDKQEFTIQLPLFLLKGDTLTIWAEVNRYLPSD